MRNVYTVLQYQEEDTYSLLAKQIYQMINFGFPMLVIMFAAIKGYFINSGKGHFFGEPQVSKCHRTVLWHVSHSE